MKNDIPPSEFGVICLEFGQFCTKLRRFIVNNLAYDWSDGWFWLNNWFWLNDGFRLDDWFWLDGGAGLAEFFEAELIATLALLLACSFLAENNVRLVAEEIALADRTGDIMGHVTQILLRRFLYVLLLYYVRLFLVFPHLDHILHRTFPTLS